MTSEIQPILPERHTEVELSPQQKYEMELVKKNLEDMIQNRKYNPYLLDEMETKSRGVLESQLSSAVTFLAGWNHFLDLLKDAREDSSSWVFYVENAIIQLDNLLKK